MANKKESEFNEWFVAQHGKRPSKLHIHELQAKYRQANDQMNDSLRLLKLCNDYDARETSALYAWQAARKVATELEREVCAAMVEDTAAGRDAEAIAEAIRARRT